MKADILKRVLTTKGTVYVSQQIMWNAANPDFIVEVPNIKDEYSFNPRTLPKGISFLDFKEVEGSIHISYKQTKKDNGAIVPNTDVMEQTKKAVKLPLSAHTRVNVPIKDSLLLYVMGGIESVNQIYSQTFREGVLIVLNQYATFWTQGLSSVKGPLCPSVLCRIEPGPKNVLVSTGDGRVGLYKDKAYFLGKAEENGLVQISDLPLDVSFDNILDLNTVDVKIKGKCLDLQTGKIKDPTMPGGTCVWTKAVLKPFTRIKNLIKKRLVNNELHWSLVNTKAGPFVFAKAGGISMVLSVVEF